MRYIVRARLVIVQPFEEIPVVASGHRFRLGAIGQARMMNKLSNDFRIQWYVFDTKTEQVYI